MPEPSRSFSSVTPLPPRVVGIGYGIFDTPANPENITNITVPATSSLYVGKDIAPTQALGSSGDWFFRVNPTSAVIYQKTNSWGVFSTITGEASADLTSVYSDLASLQTTTANLTASVSTIQSTFATQAYADARMAEAITASNGFATVSVLTEATARAAADGNLSGKYVLRVTADNVVAGMEVTSSTGAGATISEVKFQADKFQIWNGSSAQAVFSLDGSDVTISGWKINPNTLTGGNVTLNSTGVVTVGTGNDVAVMSAQNATYRFWAGNSVPGSAPFSVTKDGIMSATGANVNGTLIVGHTAPYTDSTSSKFQVINTTGQANLVQNFCFGGGTPNFEGWVASGTIGAPTSTASGRLMKLKLVTYGTGGGGVDGWNNGGNASIWLRTTEAHTSLARGTEILFKTTANGTLTENTILTLTNSGAAQFSGAVSATSFSGAGASLTGISASNISTGTLDNARLSFSVGNMASYNMGSQNPTGDVPVNGYVIINGIKVATVA